MNKLIKKTKKTTASQKRLKKPKLTLEKFNISRLIIVSVIILSISVFSAVYYLYPFTYSEVNNSEVPYDTDYVQDATLEIGQEQIRQNGTNGTKETLYTIKRTLSGKELSKVKGSEKIIVAPVKKTIARGTKKYQFMWCSDGAYRYYNSEQFKDPNTGFTHKSPDYCAENGQGHMTGLSDTEPTKPTTNTYQRRSTITNCYDNSFYSNSFSCFSY